MKIFYSWQMDAPRKINKIFIHNALSDAIAKIDAENDITEAERSGIAVDQDTQGVLGSPEISRVIFEKIAASNLIVTDVSLVASGAEGKRHINSNVAIELGYAYGKVGDGAVLKVMNTHYGQPSDLPFDLRIRRHPVQYELAPDADQAQIASERKKLAGQLASILKGYLSELQTTRQAEHAETPSVGLRGRFWETKDPLVPRNPDRHLSNDLFCYEPSILYFRCIPLSDLPALTAVETYDMLSALRPLYSASGYSRSRNKWGAISHDRDGDNIVGATQLFKNREIWGVDVRCPNVLVPSTDEDEEPKRIIPTSAVQRDYPVAIDSIRKLAAQLGYGEQYIIEMGLSGAEGIHLAIKDSYFDPYLGPFYDQEVYIRKAISADYPTKQIMNDFWKKLFSEAGGTTPEYLVWKDNKP
ncbi:MAG: hypothetical protein P1U72_20515 [Paracoccaceae bacterium]|nr:hypothetical protein [Paracoccaceae bacterium]